jgi:tripartite-type tricarboxylate transporter receptor subunit TctC
MTRRWKSLLLAVAFASISSAAHSEYPERTVKFVVPYGAGGAPDVLARHLAHELSTRLGQQFIVENRTGAGGNIGTASVAKAPADGYTLLFASEAPLAINPHVYKDPGFDPIKDFAPITALVKTAYYIIVCPNLPVSSMQDLASYGRTNNVTYASTGYGTTMNLAGELLKRALKFDMTHVPYRTVPASLGDVAACNVHVGFSAYGSGLPLIAGGKVKPLAVSSETRMNATPDVPTLRELGLGDLEQVESSFSVLAPAGTAPAIVNRLFTEITSIMKTKEMREVVEKRGMTLMLSESPADFAEWIVKANKRYKEIVALANVKAQ